MIEPDDFFLNIGIAQLEQGIEMLDNLAKLRRHKLGHLHVVVRKEEQKFKGKPR